MDRVRIIFLIVFTLASAVFGANIERRVGSAVDIIQTRMDSSRPIPNFVLDEARCIAALKVVKVGFIWGGQGSTGLVSCKTNGKWSAPSFYRVGGVSFGFQIGVQFLESVLVFVTDFSRQIIDRATFQIGADISFAAGPVGAGQGGGLMPDAHILTYSRARGLFAGASVNGFILSHDSRLNRQAYGQSVAPTELLETEGDNAVPVVKPYVGVLNRFAAP